jgi:hypothetical protein
VSRRRSSVEQEVVYRGGGRTSRRRSSVEQEVVYVAKGWGSLPRGLICSWVGKNDNGIEEIGR